MSLKPKTKDTKQKKDFRPPVKPFVQGPKQLALDTQIFFRSVLGDFGLEHSSSLNEIYVFRMKPIIFRKIQKMYLTGKDSLHNDAKITIEKEGTEYTFTFEPKE